MNEQLWIVVFLAFGVFSFVCYFAPWLVARDRQHPQKDAIGILNLFLGWTLLGWVAALVWAYTQPVAK